jgi:Domain of unknown function (DUF3883)
MRHFLVYHNPDAMGYSLNEDSAQEPVFSIVTNKPVRTLLGDRIWLITGEGRPRKYYLYETFIVDAIDRDKEKESPYTNKASGTEGQHFQPMIRLDDQPWFDALRRSQGNFAFGLQAIKDLLLINALSDAMTRGKGLAGSRYRQRGAGFGATDSNREVERAAIEAVTKNYQQAGWTVISVEPDGLGYDLLCRKESLVEHVEVKGVKGDLCSFIITANEMNVAQYDNTFKLCAVTQALTSPTLHWFNSTELLTCFDFEPTAFWARPKEQTINEIGRKIQQTIRSRK